MSNNITCVPTGVHPGYKRFPDRLDYPSVKAWRCELTALSHTYNLYFLACNDTIHVYQPSFPDQKLSSEPQLTLCLPVSPQTGSGIDPQDPHSVNRILVDYLGSDEILLVACDDGDVVGYRIDEIQRSLDERMSSTDSTCQESFHEDGAVRFFLHRNVGAGAWGLAVHQAARIIAISANTHKITVLAFALSEPFPPCKECLSHTVRPESPGNLDIHTGEPQYSRKADLSFELQCETNIPAVSFNNTGEDPSGHWLFSCSIDGVTAVWDLHKPDAPCTVFRFGFCSSVLNPASAPRVAPGQCVCVDHGHVPHGVWGALLLDTRSAYEMTIQEHDSLEPCMVEPCFKLITRQRREFSTGAPKHSIFDQPLSLRLPDDAGDDDAMVLDDESEAGTSSSGAASGQETNSQLDATVVSDKTTNTSHTYAASASSSNVSDTSLGTGSLPQANLEGIAQALEEELLQQIQATNEASTVSTPAPSFGPPGDQTAAADHEELMQANVVESDESGFDSDSIDDGIYLGSLPIGRLPQKRAFCEISTRVPLLKRPFATPIRPCLVATKQEIYLIQRPCPSSRLHPPESIITMRHPIHPGNLDPLLAPSDRLCYLTQIPELGIFIVASPVGRAAVFSMNFTKVASTSEPEYGFSLEYILPFDRDNDTELVNVPNARLVGLAVAPVQGKCTEQRQESRQSRRWRLLMYYTDHTVLSFELSKRSSSQTPDVNELVI
ncbi:hypothetical protein T440DRAFT_386704 [Plenodomus tracheiphilus IPT5]|uniref:WD40 repeat-like protein n=1 Tax=Plenodomus tracheiphilus IPT5 TaxID=1408161 RepID=A0A6A7BIF3_9PLEO|nr:hypothetical protein T440DRAFT_386704 [Plenodomus tracheiphilus IPT5]